jgi:hypothetical protein
VDPEMVLDHLLAFRTEDGVHPFWHLFQTIDLKEMVLSRPKQRAFLARYGRQDFYERHSIPELVAAVRALSEVVEQENELSRLQEDH